MAYSVQREVSDGTLVLLDISISYIERSEILVYFDGVPQTEGATWAWVGVSDAKINFSPAIANGVEVTVKRVTDLSDLRHRYSEGAAFTANSMDESFEQVLHIAQEATEGSLGGDFFQDINMHTYKIKNLGQATSPTDAVSLGQYQADAAGAWVARNEAVAAKNRAVAVEDTVVAAKDIAVAAKDIAVAAKDTAVASSTSAQGSASTATTQAGIATTKASEAAASAAAAANSVLADGAVTDAKVFAPSTPVQAIKSNKLSFRRTATNATYRWVSEKLADITSVKDFGAVGDGSTDDTVAIYDAIAYLHSQGGGQLFFPRGIYITSGVLMRSNVWLVGEGRSITTLKLKNGANRDVIMGDAAYDLFGTNSGGGVQNVGLFNLTIDGNRANNLTSGSGIVLYGEEFYFENLSVTQTREHGIRTEWGRGDSVFGMESHYSNIRIDGCGMDGWNNNGPHDSVTFNLIVIDASLNADRTFNGLVVGPNMTGRFIGCHVWNRAASFRHGWALQIRAGGGGNEFIGCHFEGAWLGNAGIFCSNNTFDPTCQFYSAWNGTNVYLGETATFNVIKGRLGSPGAGRPDSVGLVLGGAGSDWVANNDIDVFSQDQQGGVISFANSDGNNNVTVRGYQVSGAVVVGNPKGTDIVDIRVSLADTPFVRSNIIQSGTVFIGPGAGATFTFPFPFGTAPHVTFSPSGPSGNITTGVWISNLTASSVSFFNNNSVSMTLHVIARRSD